jgi:hypothetical protein
MVCHRICAWCGRLMGAKECEPPGAAENAVTHTICPACVGKVLAAVDAAVDRSGAPPGRAEVPGIIRVQ